MTIRPTIATLLEMAATNNGFDRDLGETDGWLAFASSHAPLRVWLRDEGDADYLVALSELRVARELGDLGEPSNALRPTGAAALRILRDNPSLHRLLRRAFQLSRTLRDELLHTFEKQTAALPKTTEVERLVVQRVGQNLFRDALLEYWHGRCAVTGFAIPELLRASHIKPWADCATDAERLDLYNGILLAPHMDALFDRGFITFTDDGQIVVSPVVGNADRLAVGLEPLPAPISLAHEHRRYLAWHREREFRPE